LVAALVACEMHTNEGSTRVQHHTNKPFVQENIWDPGNFYPTGTIVNYGDVYYQAQKTHLPTLTSPIPILARVHNPATISDVQGTREKDYEINDAILIQADAEVPLSGYEVDKFYILPTQNGEPANPDSLSADETVSVDGTQGGMSVTPKSDGYTMGYLTGDGIAPNGLPVTPGCVIPTQSCGRSLCIETRLQTQ
jgi:hypothetical protein